MNPKGSKVMSRPAPAARRKYRNTPTIYGGLRYDSKAEAAYAARLDMLVMAEMILWWIRQPTFRLGCPENVYRPDFLVQEHDLKVYAIDVKGARTAKFNRDCRLWKAYGAMPLHIISGKKLEIIEPTGGDS